MGNKFKGKAACCIEMLQILNTGRTYNATQLADLLDVNPRNIPEYAKELREVSMGSQGDFYVENVPGRYGGYKLSGNACIPALRLPAEEKDVLVEAYNYVLTKKDFIKKKEIIKAFSKVLSNISVEEKENNLMVVDKYQLAMSEENIQERYRFIENAINIRHKIQIEYLSLKSGLRTHVLDPYKLFIYNNSWFFLAWNQEVGDIWYFKLNRIQKYRLLDERYRIPRWFNAEEYFDKQGLTQNGNYYHCEFIATGTRAILMKERIYGKNQVVTDIDDKTVMVSLDMQNDDAIVSFVLGCGSELEVLKPDWLKDRVVKSLETMLERYRSSNNDKGI